LKLGDKNMGTEERRKFEKNEAYENLRLIKDNILNIQKEMLKLNGNFQVMEQIVFSINCILSFTELCLIREQEAREEKT
jgi:hypothetical protein